MNALALFTPSATPIIQSLAEIFEGHRVTIDLLSCVIAAFTSLMMWLSYRSIRSEKWIKYFSWFFFLLALQYLWLLSARYLVWLDGLKTNYLSYILIFLPLQLLSIANNLYGIAAARDIQNRKSPLLPIWTKLFGKGAAARAEKSERLLPRWCWVLAVGWLITTFIGYLPQAGRDQSLFEVLGRVVNSFLSAYCLALIGYVIFANLSYRRHTLLAVIGLVVIAPICAGIQVAYGLGPELAERFITTGEFQDKLRLFDSFLLGIALPLKLFLFAFAYLLVVRFFETLSDLRKLQDRGFDRRRDYLSSDGVVTLIGERLVGRVHANGQSNGAGETTTGGFVNLTIKLPGEKNKRVMCILWPNEKNKVNRILDWNPETMMFSSLSDNAAPGRRNQFPEWETALPLVNIVLTDEKRKEITWPEDQLELQTDADFYQGNMRAVVSVAIQSHGAAIGCLQIARSTSRFSQMSIRQIREIANLLSPAVQAYRELAGLDQISIRFAEKQSEESIYSPEEATQAITTILHDVFAPAVTRFHMDFGFSAAKPIYKFEKGEGDVVKTIEREISGKEWKDVQETVVDMRIVSYRLLKKQLSARVTETLSHKPNYQVPDRFIMGNLIFAVMDEKDYYNHPALTTSYLHRKAASTLAADAYLEFAREYYNYLLKRLSRELSEKRLNIDEWFEPIRRILKEDAGLLWVVAKQKGRKGRLGDEEGLCVLQRIKRLKRLAKTFASPEPPEIKAHYFLDGAESNSNHVLKLRLPNSDASIWLGVERPGFGAELDFSSPWKTFLVSFVQIADASLSRITLPEKFQLHLEAAQLQGLIASMATTGTMIHQFHNMIAGQQVSIRTLLTAIDLGELKTEDKQLKQIIHAMDDSAEKMLELFQSFAHLPKADDHRPCRLIEAAKHALKLYEVSFIPRRTEREIDVDENIFVDVSFNVAALALATLVGNSKDTIKDNGGRIRIEAEVNEPYVLCRVIDNGTGITPEIRSRIFEPKDSTKKYGTGMGLYLTSHSLSENRSSIELTKSDETGSIFTIRFPLAGRS